MITVSWHLEEMTTEYASANLSILLNYYSLFSCTSTNNFFGSCLYGINTQLSLSSSTANIQLLLKLLHGLLIFMDFLHLGEELQIDAYVSGILPPTHT